MIGTEAQDGFINKNKWAVVTTLRKDGSPASSVVFYAREGDTLLFSTTEQRTKARTLRHDPRITLTALDEGAPFGFVTVEGTATVHPVATDPWALEGHYLILKAMRGPDATPPAGYRERLLAEGRVIVKITPARISGVPHRG